MALRWYSRMVFLTARLNKASVFSPGNFQLASSAFCPNSFTEPLTKHSLWKSVCCLGFFQSSNSSIAIFWHILLSHMVPQLKHCFVFLFLLLHATLFHATLTTKPLMVFFEVWWTWMNLFKLQISGHHIKTLGRCVPRSLHFNQVPWIILMH